MSSKLPGPQDYEAAAERVIRALTALPGVVALHRFGEVACPGVSDLDFCLFYDKSIESRPLYAALRRLRRASPVALDCMLVPVELASRLDYLVSGSGMALPPALGTVESPPPSWRRQLHRSFLFLWVPVKLAALARALVMQHYSPAFLRVLYSLRYSFSLMRSLGSLDLAEMRAFERDIRVLRTAYVAGERDAMRGRELAYRALSLAQRGMRWPRGGAGVAGGCHFAVDWMSFVCITPEPDAPLQVRVGPRPLGAVRKELLPVVVQLPSRWLEVAAHFFGTAALAPYLPAVRPAVQAPALPWPALQHQAEVFSTLHASFRRHGLRRGSPISPLLRRYDQGSAEVLYRWSRFWGAGLGP